MKNTRNTTAKAAIFELIKNSEVALSHAEIQELNHESCDRVTIYRILDRLTAEDVIHKIVTPSGTVKYAACHHTDHKEHHQIHNHVHFNCEVCQLVTCLENVEPTFKLPSNYQVKQVNFTVTGICPSCAMKDVLVE